MRDAEPDGQDPVERALVRPSLELMLDGYAVLRAVREGGVIIDFRWLYVNPAGAATYGRTPRQMVGTRMGDVLPSMKLTGVFEGYVSVVETGEVRWGLDVAYRDETVDGVFDFRAWKVDDGFAVTWRDVSDRERLIAAVRLSEERFRATVERLPDSVSVFESVRADDDAIVDFRWVYANEATASMTGFDAECLVGRTLLEVFPQQGPAGMIDAYRRVVDTGEPYVEPTVWYEDTWGDGRRRRHAFDVRASKVADGFVVVTRDVTELREAAVELEHREQRLVEANNEIVDLNRSLSELVIRDALTGLYNRRHLDQTLRQAIDINPVGVLSVVQLDIDHFKAVNDRYGHDAGDVVMIALARGLQEGFRPTDVICRYGGEEFTIVLLGVPAEVAHARTDELRRRLHGRRVRHGELDLLLPTVSAGIASFPEHASRADHLVQAADAALYQAKNSGRNCVEIATAACHARTDNTPTANIR